MAGGGGEAMSAPVFHAATAGTDPQEWSAALASRSSTGLTLTDPGHVVVVGAHPDDESLGAGGLVASARELGIEVDLVCATDGRGSHPGSPTHQPEDLARRRCEEWAAAAEVLGVDAGRRHLLGLPDGAVADHIDDLARALVELIGTRRGAVLVAPWRDDGHPDHEAVATAAAAAARRTDAELWEFPVWFWHWARPSDDRVDRLRSFALEPRARQAKRAAIAAHRSQVRPLSDQPGDEELLRSEVLAHFDREREWFIVTASADCADDALERLHETVEDPWGVDTRWYERRKRDLLLAMLPRPRFRRVLELGCSTGALTEALAHRSDAVVGIDDSIAAVRRARRRLAQHPGVDLQVMDVRTTWPMGSFDVVVLSELGYFLSPATLERVVSRVATCLDPDGVVVLCHWRHRVEGWVLTADDVHGAFATKALPPLQATYRDGDVELRVFARGWPEYDR
jgi:LmbE family N-acetylglucosaminyl deacetylase/protein-L-isoaspartate O-methyltransferase